MGRELRAGRPGRVLKSGVRRVRVFGSRAPEVAGGGAGGGAWPRCGAARNPSWRSRGSVFVPEQRWSRSRFPGLAAEEPLRCPRPLPAGGGWVLRRSSRDVTARRRRRRPGPGEGVSRAETPGLGAAQAAGPPPPSIASRCRSRESPSSLTAPPRLWDPGGGLLLPPDLGHPVSRGVEERRPRVSRPCRAPAASLFPSSRPSLRFPAPSLASEPPVHIPSLLSSGLPFIPSLLPGTSNALTAPNVTDGPPRLSPAKNFNAKEKPGLVSPAF